MRLRLMSGMIRIGPSGYSSLLVRPGYSSKTKPSHIRLSPETMFTFPPTNVIGFFGLTDQCPPSGSRFTINEAGARSAARSQSTGTTVTFTVNANSLTAGTYGPTTIAFTNSDTGQGTQTRSAAL